jgi:hypothetical protein
MAVSPRKHTDCDFETRPSSDNQCEKEATQPSGHKLQQKPAMTERLRVLFMLFVVVACSPELARSADHKSPVAG